MIEIFENSNLALGLVKKLEAYQNPNNKIVNTVVKIVSTLVCIIMVSLWVYALVQAIKCINNGVGQICDLMAACCVPHLYIIYRSARPCKTI